MLLLLPFLPLLPIPPLRALRKFSLSPPYLPSIYWPAVSLGILSGSQHGSSSNCPPFDLVPLCLYVCVLVFYDGFSLSFVCCTPIFSLVGPAWAYCPARPLSPPSLRSLRSLHLSFLFSFLSFFIIVSPCHFVLDLSLPLASLRVFPNFLPFVASLGILSGSSLLSILRTILSSSAPLPPLLSPFCPTSSLSLF